MTGYQTLYQFRQKSITQSYAQRLKALRCQCGLEQNDVAVCVGASASKGAQTQSILDAIGDLFDKAGGLNVRLTQVHS